MENTIKNFGDIEDYEPIGIWESVDDNIKDLQERIKNGDAEFATEFLEDQLEELKPYENKGLRVAFCSCSFVFNDFIKGYVFINSKDEIVDILKY